jgi:protein SCO1/2
MWWFALLCYIYVLAPSVQTHTTQSTPSFCPNRSLPFTTPHAETKLPKETLTPAFVTLDPYRDSCAQVETYAREFHPRMLGLTGTPAQVAKAAKKFRVYFSETDHAEGDDDYLGE